jgi:hypothetical protein
MHAMLQRKHHNENKQDSMEIQVSNQTEWLRMNPTYNVHIQILAVLEVTREKRPIPFESIRESHVIRCI